MNEQEALAKVLRERFANSDQLLRWPWERLTETSKKKWLRDAKAITDFIAGAVASEHPSSCNRHDDCRAADARGQENHTSVLHCRDVACPTCVDTTQGGS